METGYQGSQRRIPGVNDGQRRVREHETNCEERDRPEAGAIIFKPPLAPSQQIDFRPVVIVPDEHPVLVRVDLPRNGNDLLPASIEYPSLSSGWEMYTFSGVTALMEKGILKSANLEQIDGVEKSDRSVFRKIFQVPPFNVNIEVLKAIVYRAGYHEE